MKRVAVFAGPSLPPEDRVPADGLEYLPSARRGDVANASQIADAVLLIDGLFQEELAPSPKEMLQACRRCTVIGAASLGALRAVECAPFGAHPCGAIARWYGTGFIDGDDEVAVIVHPESERALSVPLVNVRHLLYLAQRRQLLSRSACAKVLERARNVFYADRTWDDVLESVPARNRAAAAQLARSSGDLKRLDARFALRSVLRRMRRAAST